MLSTCIEQFKRQAYIQGLFIKLFSLQCILSLDKSSEGRYNYRVQSYRTIYHKLRPQPGVRSKACADKLNDSTKLKHILLFRDVLVFKIKSLHLDNFASKRGLQMKLKFNVT